MEALSDADPCVAVLNMYTRMLPIANVHVFVSFKAARSRPFGRRQVTKRHAMVNLALEGQQQMVDPVQEVGPKRMELAQEDPQRVRDPVQEVARPQLQLDEVAGTDSPQKTLEQLVPGTISSHAAQRLAVVSP